MKSSSDTLLTTLAVLITSEMAYEYKPMTEPVEVDKEKIELLSIVLIEFTAISYFWAR